MAITRVSYSYVEAGGPRPECRAERVSVGIEAYLEAHVASLLKAAAGGASPPARFQNDAARQRFRRLLEGTDANFLAGGQELADRLHVEMDNRSKRGFFVALVTQDGAEKRAGVLKLDVHDKSAAAMARTAQGRLTLEAVKDLLDVPGDLQKGAVFRDDRPRSDVVVGDRLTETSYYFLRAIDAVQTSKAGQATGALIAAVAAVAAPDRTVEVIRALEAEGETTPADFFTRHPELLDEEQRSHVTEQLRLRKRPVERVDPREHVIEEMVSADGITVRGRASVMAEKLRVEERPGGWRIVISVQEEPRREFR